MVTNLVAKWGKITYPLHLSLCQSKTELDIATSICALTAQMMPLYRVQILELWSSNSRENGAHLYTFFTTWQKSGIFSQISQEILDRFLQSFHHMKAL